MIVTLTPFGVPSEYSCRGWRPTGSSFSCVGPAIGRLMFANAPPLGLFQVQTLGGVYSTASFMGMAPGGWDVTDGLHIVRRRPNKSPLARRGRGSGQSI